MKKNDENFVVKIGNAANEHIGIIGCSKFGKTYTAKKIIEKSVAFRKGALIFDITNEYTTKDFLDFIENEKICIHKFDTIPINPFYSIIKDDIKEVDIIDIADKLSSSFSLKTGCKELLKVAFKRIKVKQVQSNKNTEGTYGDSDEYKISFDSLCHELNEMKGSKIHKKDVAKIDKILD